PGGLLKLAPEFKDINAYKGVFT
nr:28 K secretory protein - rat (fragments) [Rattus norvegicus]